MDPFLEIEYLDKKFCTKVKQEEGKNPVWNEEFEFNIESLDDCIKIKCYDNDIIVDDLIGETIIPLSEICSEEFNDWV